MLTPKEITEIFEVQLNTLYNWRKSKPKLFSYLQNADFHLSKVEEMNVLLQSYQNQMEQKYFNKMQIAFIVSSSLELNSLEEVEVYEKKFIAFHHRDLSVNSDLILAIYENIKNLNLIEKYILYKKVFRVRKEKEYNLEKEFQKFIS